MNELRVAAPIAVAGVILIPIERVRIVAARQWQACCCNAAKDIAALVICEAGGPRAVDVAAQPLAIDELIGEIPELGAALAEFYPSRSDRTEAPA